MRRAGGVTAICVAAIILGALGLLSSVAGIAGMLLGERLRTMVEGMQAQSIPPQARNVQQKMNQQMLAMARRWRPVVVPLIIFHLAASVLLIVGAIGTLTQAPTGYQLLIWGLWGSLGYVVLYAPINLILTVENYRIVQQFMPELMQAGRPQAGAPAPPVDEMMQTTMRISVALGIGWTVVWSLVQGGFYTFSALYIKKLVRRSEYPRPVMTL